MEILDFDPEKHKAQKWMMSEEECEFWRFIADNIYTMVPNTSEYLNRFLEEPLCEGFILKTQNGEISFRPLGKFKFLEKKPEKISPPGTHG